MKTVTVTFKVTLYHDVPAHSKTEMEKHFAERIIDKIIADPFLYIDDHDNVINTFNNITVTLS